VHWKSELPLEGVIALFAGVIAFVAVMIQLEEERNSRVAELERQKRALVKVVLFEINNFYCYHVRDVQEFLKHVDVENCKFLGIKTLSPDPFPVYRGNAGMVGVMDDDMLGNVIGFYSTAEVYLNLLRDYKIESERYFQNTRDEVAEDKARTYLRQMKSTGPEITKLIYVLSEKLSKVAGVEFRSPTIAVAAEGLTTEQIAASLEGVNAKED